MIHRISRLLLIQAGERREVMYFVVLFFLLGCGMAIGRASADALFFKRYGIEYLPLMYLIQGGVLFMGTVSYASYADHLAPERLLRPVIFIHSGLLAALWLSMTLYDWVYVYPLYFLLYELISEILVVHCMLYVAQNFNVMQAKRLTPVIWGGWQIGAVLGGLLLAAFVKQTGLQVMLLVWVFLLGTAAILVSFYHKRVGVSPYHRTGRKGRHPVRHAFEQLSQGIAFARQSSLLKAMSLALFFMVITFYVLCYSVNRVYTNAFETEAQLSVFFGMLGATTGVIALVIQIFITNRLIRRYGVRRMNLVFPGMTLTAFGMLMLNFAVPTALFASVVKDALMPALRNPVRALFFNVLPSFIQGRSHAVSVGIVLPLALAVAGMALMLAQQIKDVFYFLIIGMMTALGYLYYSGKMNQSYVVSLISSLRQKLFVPDEKLIKTIQGDEEQAIKVLEQASHDTEADIRFAAAKSMLELFPDRAGPVALRVLSGLQPPLRDQLFRMLEPLEPPLLRDCLWKELEAEDIHLRATVMYILFKLRDEKAKSLINGALHDENPRIQAIGIYGAMSYPVAECAKEAMDAWRAMLQSNDKSRNLAALDLLKKWPNTDFAPLLTRLLRSADPRIQYVALDVVSVWPDSNIEALADIINNLLHNKDIHICVQAAKCIDKLDDADRTELARSTIENDHPEIRQSAARALFPTSCSNDDIVDWLLGDTGSPRAHEVVINLLLERKPPRRIMEKIAYHKALQANHFLEAQQLIQQVSHQHENSTGMDMLKIILLERCRQFLDQALLATKQYEDETTVGVIRAGLMSDDKRYLASASEAIRYIKDQALARVLVIVLEKLMGEPSKKNNIVLPFSDVNSLMDWLRQINDSWLSECVEYACLARQGEL